MNTWSDIAVFLAVMRNGSAAAAARQLGTNQTTISRRIERLEQTLGLKLFEKGPRGAQPTENARQLFPEAEKMGKAVDAVRSRAESLKRQLSGTIRLTCTHIVARHGIWRVLREFQSSHPDVQFELNTEDRLLSLEDGEADVAIRDGEHLGGETLIARKLFDHPWGFYASKAYVEQRGMPDDYASLTAHDLIAYVGFPVEQVEVVRMAHEKFPEDRIKLRSPSLDGMIGMLNADEGVGLLPRAVGDAEAWLVHCFADPAVHQSLYVVTSPDGHATPAIREFMGFLGNRSNGPFRHLPEEWRM